MTYSPVRDSNTDFDAQGRTVHDLATEVGIAAHATIGVLEQVVQGLDTRKKKVTTLKVRKGGKGGGPSARSVPPIRIHQWTDRNGPIAPAPAWTDGQDIWITAEIFRPSSSELSKLWSELPRNDEGDLTASAPGAVSLIDFSVFKGAAYHEFSHIAYSPRVGGYVSEQIRSTALDRRAWNLLEDHRIETLFSAKYVGAKPYFTDIVYKLVLAKGVTPEALLWIWGRRYLSVTARRQALQLFTAHYGLELATRVCSLIDEFVDTPQKVHAIHQRPTGKVRLDAVARLLQVIEEFAEILNSIQTTAIGEGRRDPFGEGQGRGHDNQSGGAPAPDAPDAPEGEDASIDGEGEPTEGEATSSGDSKTSDEDGPEGDSKGSGSTESDGKSDDGDPQDLEDGETGKGSSANGSPSGDGFHPENPEKDALHSTLQDEQKAAQEEISADVQPIRDAVRSLLKEQTTLPTCATNDSPVPVEFQVIEKQIRRTLARLNNSLVATTEKKVRDGRVNPLRYARTGNVETAFDKWKPSVAKDADIEIVIALDHSGSIAHADVLLGAAAWALKSAVEKTHSGRCGVIGFNGKSSWIYRIGETVSPGNFKYAPHSGGTNPSGAIREALRLLQVSKSKSKLLVLLTDGHYGSSASDKLVQLANRLGIQTVGIEYKPDSHQGPWFDSIRKAYHEDPNSVSSYAAKDVQQWEEFLRTSVLTGGTRNFSAGSDDLTDHKFDLAFRVFNATGFADVVQRVVDNIRSQAATGKDSLWVIAQKKAAGGN
ncbi:vWFA domain containing protein [uncultured Caudovirales phage]|uniref:VWFA domain containing protein n=1 Tax=uncultured Caudovirales phage TaxID=2100421 RepID=A0A6J5Q4V0_9CAUD|nr:vWFA domain containing protein [uncultured Caudovirales phage]